MSDSTARRLAVWIVALTALLTLGVGIWRVYMPRSPHVELDRNRYPIVGIDISAHNGAIDFDSLAAAGVDFVYIKASEGVDWKDKAFRGHCIGARRVGLQVGAYHFFRFDGDGISQAANFLEAIKDCELTLPPVIDVEEWGNKIEASTNIINERLEAMRTMVTLNYAEPVIYTNKNGVARFLSHLDPASCPPLWICSFTDPPTRRDWLFWQHSHIGHLPGIKGHVDLNTFNGSRADWNRFIDAHRPSLKQ